MTLDTNILIAYLGGEASVIAQILTWRRNGTHLFISTICMCELLAYPKLTNAEEEKIRLFLQENFIILPFDEARASQTAKIRRTLPSIKIPDAAIAALAQETNTPLVTRNIKDFRKVKDITLIPL